MARKYFFVARLQPRLSDLRITLPVTIGDDTLAAGGPLAGAPREATARKTRAIVATSIGNMLEWYDFTVYALFAATSPATSFPPAMIRPTNLLKTFLFFGLGFVVRPLGAVLIGNYGDRAGRKAALTLTILLMAVGTAVIAFAPTYASIGLGAPLLLLLGRVLQGFSAGGEIGGAIAYLLESAHPARRGRIVAWVQASMGMSNILGALAAFSVTALFESGRGASPGGGGCPSSSVC